MQKEGELSLGNALKRFPVTPKEIGADKQCLGLLVLGSVESIQASQEVKGNNGVSAAKRRAEVVWPRVAGLGQGAGREAQASCLRKPGF